VAAVPEEAQTLFTRRKFLKSASIGAAGSLGFASAGFASALSLPGLRRSTLELAGFPRDLDGLTILQISDVHAGLHMSVERMQRIRELVSSLPVDLIVFTGDQIDRRPVDAEMFTEGFRGLEAPLGVFGVLGNHDYYVDRYRATSLLADAGITPLVNQSVVIDRGDARIALVGVDDLWAPGEGPDFSILQQHPDAFRICLCHQPQGWEDARAAGAHLTLAGHTHGGQIALPTRNLNVARLQTRYIAGPYRHDEATLYVSRGIGVGALPLRVGAPPELDVLTLRTPAKAIGVAA
jgi:predicted MPP superfamily phosphohydrolase